MAWFYLMLAGFFEICWPIGLKWAHTHKFWGISVAAVTMCISGFLLFLSQKTIPIGTAYAVWTGIGAAGAFLAGVCLWGDPLSLWRVVGVILIVGGVITLKLSS